MRSSKIEVAEVEKAIKRSSKTEKPLNEGSKSGSLRLGTLDYDEYFKEISVFQKKYHVIYKSVTNSITSLAFIDNITSYSWSNSFSHSASSEH